MQTDVESLFREKKADPLIKHLAQFCEHMRIRMYRMEPIRKLPLSAEGEQLDEQENQAFQHIYQHFLTRLRQESMLSEQQAKDVLDYCAAAAGKKNFVRYYTETACFMGVPVRYVVCEVAMGAAAYIIFQTPLAYLVTAVIAHIIFLMYYKKNHTQLRQKKINKIMSEGIKI